MSSDGEFGLKATSRHSNACSSSWAVFISSDGVDGGGVAIRLPRELLELESDRDDCATRPRPWDELGEKSSFGGLILD